MADIRVAKNEATAARRRAYFFLVDATDGITPETGEAGGQPQVSVDGGAWTNTGIGTLTAIGNGQYYADLTQALVNVDDAVIRTRYKSSATAECPGDTVIVDSRAHNANVTQINGGATNDNNAVLKLKALDITNGDADLVSAVTINKSAGTGYGVHINGTGGGMRVLTAGSNKHAVELNASAGGDDLRLAGAKHNLFTIATSALTTAGSIGKLIVDGWTALTATRAENLDKLVGTLAAGTHSPQGGDAFTRLGAPTGASIAADIAQKPSASQIADAVWDEVLTGAAHNVPSSAGRRLRNVAAAIVLDGTAQGAGSNGNQIILAADASAVNGAYDPAIIAIHTGTGAGQCRLILEYDGATKTATVDRDWKVLPDATSEYVIYADAGREHVNEGLAQGGSPVSITLNANASASDDAYIGQRVFIRSGTGADQARRIAAYDGTTKVATVTSAWSVVPDTTSAYVMLPTGSITDHDLGNGVWSDAEGYAAGTKGAKVGELTFTQPGKVDATAEATIDPDAVGAAVWSYATRTITDATPVGWVELTGDTLDSLGVALGPLDAADILVSAFNEHGTLINSTRSEGDGGFSLFVPLSATYTLRAERVGYTYPERTVVVP